MRQFICRRGAFCAFVFWSSGGWSQEIHPSFNCNRAQFADERAICSDDHLAQLDQANSIALNQISRDAIKEARQTAYGQLLDRHKCGANRLCILDSQVETLSTLDGFGAKVPMPPWIGTFRLDVIEAQRTPFVTGLPKLVGVCTRTKISGIADRFGDEVHRASPEEPTTGTSVTFANGGYGVSYEYEDAVANSAVGDDVVLCLVSIPKDCPKGDDRGKTYSGTNLRTKQSWILPDAQHMCGGASRSPLGQSSKTTLLLAFEKSLRDLPPPLTITLRDRVGQTCAAFM